MEVQAEVLSQAVSCREVWCQEVMEDCQQDKVERPINQVMEI